MKRILVVVAVGAIGMVSCKKEEVPKPSTIEKTPVAGVRGELSDWD